jgi:DNA-directed RNA polymerase specialized sigma24 family protein
MSFLEQAHLFGFAEYVSTAETLSSSTYRQVYEENRHRIYALAFWMTGNELAAEELMTSTFRRIFGETDLPTQEEIDRALIAEVRQVMPFGDLSLQCAPSDRVLSVRTNTMRVDLERAVLQLPATERMIFLLHDVEDYDHARIARTLGLTENESRDGLHQARLRVRELLAK